jgi:hypothetical protein
LYKHVNNTEKKYKYNRSATRLASATTGDEGKHDNKISKIPS